MLTELYYGEDSQRPQQLKAVKGGNDRSASDVPVAQTNRMKFLIDSNSQLMSNTGISAELEKETNTEKGSDLPRVRAEMRGARVVIYCPMFFAKLPPLISVNMPKNSQAIALLGEAAQAANSPRFIRL